MESAGVSRNGCDVVKAPALLVLAACSARPEEMTTPSPATPLPAETGTPAPAPAPTDPHAAGSGADTGAGSAAGSAVPPSGGAKLGEPCSAGGSCGQGACVSYYGIAGPRGPEFKSCEIRCNEKTSCPSGLTCRTIADGPGSVCR